MSKTSDTKYLNALYAKSWITLIAYNKLLFSWQHQFNDPKTIRQIATVASHKRRMHHFCGDNCEVVDDFMKKRLVIDILHALSQRKKQLGQTLIPFLPSGENTAKES